LRRPIFVQGWFRRGGGAPQSNAPNIPVFKFLKLDLMRKEYWGPCPHYSIRQQAVGVVSARRAGWIFFVGGGRDTEPPPHQLGNRGSAVSSSSVVRGGAPAAHSFLDILVLEKHVLTYGIGYCQKAIAYITEVDAQTKIFGRQ